MMLTKRLLSIVVMMVLCLTIQSSFASTSSLEQQQAEALKQLNLFKGVSDTDFDLNRPPSRIEAMVMLIRILGEESSALDGTYQHPFNDVPSWADAYIGYAYENGLSKGISDTAFGTSDASDAMFLTFVLRALGYREGVGLDFVWHEPFELAKETGILSEAMNLKPFYRGGAVRISAAALQAQIRQSTQTLADHLIDNKVFTRMEYETVKSALIKEDKMPLQPVLAETMNLTVLGQNKTVQVVTVDLNDPNVYLEVVSAHDGVQGSEPFVDMIQRKNPLVAINGNFFDAYRTLEPSGTLMKRGHITYLEGRNTSFVFGDFGEQIEYFSSKVMGYLDGHRANAWNESTQSMDFNLFEIWYVNNLPYDSTGVYLYTRDRGSAIGLDSGTAIVVDENRITQVLKNPGSVYIPRNGYVIYYAKDAASERFIDARFKVGRTIELLYEANVTSIQEQTQQSTSHLTSENIKLFGSIDGETKNRWNNATNGMDYFIFTIWYINALPNDSSGIYLYTPERGTTFEVPLGKTITVEQGVITHMDLNATKVSIPKTGFVIYIGQHAMTDDQILRRFDVGKTIDFYHETTEVLDTEHLIQYAVSMNMAALSQPITANQKSTFDLNQANGIISAGPILIREGQVVVDAAMEGFEESKITTNRAMRSALGLTNDRQLILVTGSNLNVEELAYVMKALGCETAMNLDGGASSALYANGRVLTQPGRSLNTVLMVRKR